ncbi:hypothetical protein FEM48_Zijuj03G0086700 [Ziziphus jujuba var. spinosa]|uniref:Uncharacterized protein n=1 Tax=Ziziphus jujuba var. spinosa TaxID=714518 RepID=A0A978VPA8_ZIZJJ|nr:hypothetical protein FEM48_Zijuj03G0086700 [Ziziphus jujuba var. spinosa]
MEYYYSTNHLHETPQKEDYIEEAEEEDALSLCDFTFQDEPISSLPQPNLPTSFPSDSDDFEFSIGTEIKSERLPPLENGIVFCGKSIPHGKPVVNLNLNIPTTTSTQKPFIEDPFCLRSESFNLLRGSTSHFANRSKSVRLPENGNCRYQSSSSRKHKVLIGLVKFPTRMELSDIRKRQDRIAPVPMFHVADGSQPVVAGGGSGGRGHWSLLRRLRFRSHIVGSLARASFGCMSRV